MTATVTNGRARPHHLQAEESLLGSCLLARQPIEDASTVLRPADFYVPAHEHIFDAILALYGVGESTIDPITVAAELERRGTLKHLGGPGQLVALQSNAPAISSAKRYALMIEEASAYRSLIDVGSSITELGYSRPDSLSAALDEAQRMVLELRGHKAGSLFSVGEMLGDTLDRLEKLYEQGDAVTGMPTGFLDLDEMTSGLQPGGVTIVAGRPAMGKALALDTPLPTPTGWTTMGEVQVGDYLLSDQGAPCAVTFATPVQLNRECYLVTFDDSSTLVADADHQWFVYDHAAWKSKRERHYRSAGGYSDKPLRYPGLSRDQSARWKHPRVVTTRQMLEEGITVGSSRRPNWYLPLTAPVDLPDRDLPLDPYLLGCWLGDGHTASAAITTEDEEIVQAFKDAGFPMRPKTPAGRAVTYSISHGHATASPWVQKIPDAAVRDGRRRVSEGEVARDVAKEIKVQYGLRRHDYVLSMLTGRARPYAANPDVSFVARLLELGVLRNKHIPASYLRASFKQRLALLQGLMDTDGTIGNTTDNGTASLCLANRDLLEQARELVCSLGEKPSRIKYKPCRAESGGRVCDSWRFAWMPLNEAFRLTRKAERLARAARRCDHGRATRRVVRSIVPVPSVPVRCVTVDSPSHLYLAGDSMIPTHNTSAAMGIAAHATMVAGRVGLVHELEMSRTEIMARLLGSEARVDSTRMRNGRLNESDWAKIADVMERVAAADLWIDDNAAATALDIRAQARQVQLRRGRLDFVVVDHIGLVPGPGKDEQERVSNVSRALKVMAKDLNTHLIVCAQLNRGLEQRADKRPTMADLRSSGSLEQDADNIFFLYRDEVYNRESTDQGIAEVIVAKQRNGPTGLVRLAFLGQYTRFASMARN